MKSTPSIRHTSVSSILAGCCILLLGSNCEWKDTGVSEEKDPVQSVKRVNKQPNARAVIVPLAHQPTPEVAKPPEIVPNPEHGIPFFTSIRTAEGLPTAAVSCSAKDSKGHLWLGTIAGGICRFDGKNFTTYTIANGLPGNVIICIDVDKDDNVWIGTTSGLSRYDGYRFTNYSTVNGLPASTITCLTADRRGVVWVGSLEGGLSSFDGKIFKNYLVNDQLPDTQILNLYEGESALWIATATGGAIKYDGEQFTRFTTNDGLPSNTITSIYEDQNKIVWLGTYAGLSKFDGEKFTTYESRHGLPPEPISCIIGDENGNILLGTQSKGVVSFNGTKFSRWTMDHGLPDDAISSFIQDVNGRIWLTTRGGGISRYEGSSFQRFRNIYASKSANVSCITKGSGQDIWLGGFHGGVTKYDRTNFISYFLAQGLPDDVVWWIYTDDSGQVWIGTSKGGLSKFDGTSFTNFNTAHGLPGNGVYRITGGLRGELWIATNKGLSQFDGKSFTNYTSAQGLPSDNLVAVTMNKKTGDLWISTHDDGVSRFDGRRFTNYSTSDGLASNTVYDIVTDKKGNVWFATNNGVTRFDGSTFKTFRSSSGLAGDFVWSIAADTLSNKIWFGTTQGLCAFSEGENGHYQFEVFNDKSGYPLRDVNVGGILLDSAGVLWLGSTEASLIRFDPSRILRKPDSLQLAIREVRINGESICWNILNKKEITPGPADSANVINEMLVSFSKRLKKKDLDNLKTKYKNVHFDEISRFDPIPTNLILPYDANTLTLEIAAIAPSLKEGPSYTYRLEGGNNAWTTPSSNSTIVLGNLDAGSYTIHIKAESPFGNFRPMHYSFTVLSPWWRTWWANLFYGITISGLLYGFYRNRISAHDRKRAAQMNLMVRIQEEERKRIARDLHDDIGSKLSALRLYLSALKENAADPRQPDYTSLAEKSENLVREAVQDVRQLLLNLSPGVLEEFGFKVAVEGLVTSINETGQLKVDLIFFGLNDRLLKDYELALYRITQELLTNVVKHAGASQVSLQIGRRDKKILVMVEDDGVGFDAKNRQNGNGLHNLQIRTRLLNGSFVIDSHPGQGTSVLIEIPYSQR